MCSALPDAFCRFPEVDAVLAEAFELPAAERRAYVKRVCADDTELRDHTLRLLAASEEEGELDGPSSVSALLADVAKLGDDEIGATSGVLQKGARFGAYVVLGPVGAGGMGEVYRARDTRLGREVALKVLPEEFAGDNERLARFEREARLLATLNHPGINAIHELEEYDGRKALVLELVDGQTLSELLAAGPLPVEQALEITGQIAEALDVAHRHGILHRDLKPANVKLTGDGQVKVLDFGLAKGLQPALAESEALSQMTAPGRILGTAPYIGPEVLRGKEADARQDIWALGCVAFELLSGTRTFGGATPAEVAAAVLEREPDLTLLPDGVPSPVRDLIERCLDKDPERRPTMSEIARAILGSRSAGLQRARSRARIGSWPAIAAATAVALALLAWLVTATGLLSNRSTDDAPIDSIVVLPFENTGDAPDGEYLSDGITDGLINSLSKLPDLRVVPRGVAYAYAGRGSSDPEAVAAELGVRALLTGRVGEHDGRVVVGTELTDAAEMAQLWGEQYTYAADDLLKLQEDLVRNILDRLRLELTPEQRQRILNPATENPEAYRLFLKARYHIFQLTAEGLDKGLEYARQAIELDPSFAHAYVNLSAAHMTRAFAGREPWAEAGAKSRAASRRALELDELLPEAHIEQGFVRHHFDWDWAGAERSFRRALELDSENWEAFQGLSEALTSQGRLDEAVSAGERSVELAPFNPTNRNWLANCYRQARRFEDGLRANIEATELQPTHLLARRSYPTHLFLAGRQQEAVELLREALSGGAGSTTSALLAAFQALSGDVAGARKTLEELGPDVSGREPSFELALALALVGERDRAFEILDALRAQRSRSLLWLNTEPMWDPVRDDPRFQSLLREMGFS